MQMEVDPDFECDFRDEEVLQAAVDELLRLGNAACDCPLTAGTTFAATLNCVTPHPHGRAPPRFASQLRRAYAIVLDHALHAEKGKLEVWLAHVVDPADGTVGEIVVKVVQPSLLVLPDQPEYVPPKKVAYTEDWMYRRLQPLQGYEIPYYFGVHTIVTPSGEGAWMLTMEYIQGHTITQYLNTLHDSSNPDITPVPIDVTPETHDRMKQIMVSSLEGINAIHARGVLHGAVQSDNIVISTACPAGPLVVYIDFARGVEYPGDNTHAIDNEQYAAPLFAIKCCAAHGYPLQEWGKSALFPNGPKYPRLRWFLQAMFS
ncbi:hypothetical protein PLICRDRAFT_179848 [Plicaturopsis crispa FD-325 SS-3]|uniref:Protein kinase domain-containing protein n=1 Tax=Plicaturopsis crispa FD-325 SS-3 TaxID=944288 RepID=A0A0C9T7M7_PLICR|nr:hypothetical protein PLICRDRAFT_179848 [Plicaturopsis crispa FD-325 SS-3]